MAVFIVFPINVPTKIAQLINTSTGKITLAFVVLNVFLKNHILGVMIAIASYELIKRSAGQGSIFSGLNKSHSFLIIFEFNLAKTNSIYKKFIMSEDVYSQPKNILVN